MKLKFLNTNEIGCEGEKRRKNCFQVHILAPHIATNLDSKEEKKS